MNENRLSRIGNRASERVLEKAGLHFVSQAPYFGITCNKFVVHAKKQEVSND